MRMERKFSIIVLTIMAILFSTIPHQVKATDPWVKTFRVTNQGEVETDRFQFGETVRIRWEGFQAPVTIQIRFGGVTVATFSNLGGSGSLDYVPNSMGQYEIRVPSDENPDRPQGTHKFWWGTFLVIPEVPLGSLGALTALFSGLGLTVLGKRKAKSSQ